MVEGEGAVLEDCRFEEERLHCSSRLRKKRKFQSEYLSPPLSKPKFRDRPCSISVCSDGSSSVITDLESDETTERFSTCNEPQSLESSPGISQCRCSSENPVPCPLSSISSCLPDRPYSPCSGVPSSKISTMYDEILIEAEDEALETYDDYIGEITHASIEELTTYSNEVTSDLSLYSSPRWDASLGSRKPTIDEEFERYFSALLL